MNAGSIWYENIARKRKKIFHENTIGEDITHENEGSPNYDANWVVEELI